VRMRAPDDADPHRRCRRRLDPAFPTARGCASAPDSAGANPAQELPPRRPRWPVTDANVMAGKLIADFFPKIFGPDQDQPLDSDTVHAAFHRACQRGRGARSPEEIADSFIRIAVENMANAIKKISVQRGYDVTRYTLNCFGGAGGQHACLVADALGMTNVLIHPYSSLLSAYGMGPRRHSRHAPAGDRGTAAGRRRCPRPRPAAGRHHREPCAAGPS